MSKEEPQNRRPTKVEEGHMLMQKAEKSCKTNLLKWKPEYDVAADEYIKAAICFRAAKSYDLSRDCFMKAVECYKNNRSWFHAAKCYEQIIMVLRETENLSTVEETANKAAHLYLQYGSAEAAASVLEKAAKILERKHPEAALNIYKHAIEVATNEDSTRQAAEYASKLCRLMVKLKMYDEAAKEIHKQILLNQQSGSYPQIGRLTVALVLVQLARCDYVAAEQAFKQWGNCCDRQEVSTLEMLLQGYDEEDGDTVKSALASPFIRHMDVEYSILARDLPIPGETTIYNKLQDPPTTSAKAVKPEPSASASGSGTVDDEPEDEGLC